MRCPSAARGDGQMAVVGLDELGLKHERVHGASLAERHMTLNVQLLFPVELFF